jgi:hypothetical protein
MPILPLRKKASLPVRVKRCARQGQKVRLKRKTLLKLRRPLPFKEGGSIEQLFKPTQSDFIPRSWVVAALTIWERFWEEISATKKLSKDSEIEGYVEGFAAKPKDGPSMSKITGGGVKYTKRFCPRRKVSGQRGWQLHQAWHEKSSF